MAALAAARGRCSPSWPWSATTACRCGSSTSGVLAASAIATGAIEFWGEGAESTPLPYLWPTLYAFYFFSVRSALAHMAVLGIMFAALLVARDPGYVPVAAWATTLGTLTTAGLLVAYARDRLNTLIAKLSDAARRDPLTQLLNRRGFTEVFDVELERARRTEQGLSVVVGDLDGFKQINDRFGHAAGDEALQRVGRAILRGKRSWDSAARVGGEEFAILAPDTDEHGAYIVAERLRTAVESRVRRTPRSGRSPLSFGIVSFPVHGQTAEALLQAGDQALYAAKRLGRNRSVISSAEVPGILARTPRPGRDEAHVELGHAAHARRGARRARLRELHPLPAGGPLRGADRPRAGPAARRRGARAAGRHPPRRGPRGHARRAGCRRAGRSASGSGSWCARTPRSAPGCWTPPTTPRWASGSSPTTSARTAPATRRGAGATRCRWRARSSRRRTPTRR